MEVAYTVLYHPLVVREDLPALDATVKVRIRHAIELKLQTAPDLYGIPLRRSLKGHRKLRVGEYRVVFRLEKKHVMIVAIQHRSKIYQHLDSRVGTR